MHNNRIEIVTHCWAKQLEQYAWHLQLQLSSIWWHAPLEVTKVTICCCAEDTLTWKVMQSFRERMPQTVYPMYLNRSELFRRAIGRNFAAKTTQADLIWFTDVDYFFGEGCLQTLSELPTDLFANLMMPQVVHRQNDWESGDELVRRISSTGIGAIMLPDPAGFYANNESIAIGGLHIVPGDYARRHGYLAGTKWVKPVSTAEGFRKCSCDVPFRKSIGLGKRGKQIDLPNVFRVRHTKDGRDYADE